VVNSWRTKKETSRRTVIAMWQNVLWVNWASMNPKNQKNTLMHEIALTILGNFRGGHLQFGRVWLGLEW
jgi:hypothetical protein